MEHKIRDILNKNQKFIQRVVYDEYLQQNAKSKAVENLCRRLKCFDVSGLSFNRWYQKLLTRSLTSENLSKSIYFGVFCAVSQIFSADHALLHTKTDWRFKSGLNSLDGRIGFFWNCYNRRHVFVAMIDLFHGKVINIPIDAKEETSFTYNRRVGHQWKSFVEFEYTEHFQIVDNDHLLFLKTNSDDPALYFLEFDNEKRKYKLLDKFAFEGTVNPLSMLLDRSNGIKIAFSIRPNKYAFGELKDGKIIVSNIIVTLPEKSLLCEKYENRKICGFRLNPDKLDDQFLNTCQYYEYDVETEEVEIIEFEMELPSDVAIQWSLENIVCHCWTGNLCYGVLCFNNIEPYFVVCIFDIGNNLLKKTSICGVGRPTGIFVDVRGICTISVNRQTTDHYLRKQKDINLIYRYPLNEPETLQAATCLSILRNHIFKNERDNYNELQNFLLLNSDLKCKFPDAPLYGIDINKNAIGRSVCIDSIAFDCSSDSEDLELYRSMSDSLMKNFHTR